jgi:uncharacterized tellurite resistance protein B-like protein
LTAASGARTIRRMPVTRAPEEVKFAFEVVKLLLQAVWADGEVAPEEAEALHDYAVRSGVSQTEIETLDACLTGQSPLPPPNFALLKPRRKEVLALVHALLHADRRVHEDEEALLGEVSSLLE